jgi:predicted  nucleic acid-binding Zn-ribbon protein
MSINTLIDEIEGLLSDLRNQYDDEVEDVKKEISSLDDEIEVLKNQNDVLEEAVQDLVNRNYLLECKIVHLELELVENFINKK